MDKNRLFWPSFLRLFQNPQTTANAEQVFDALEINQHTRDNYYADQVAEQNVLREQHIKGKEIRRG